MKINQEKILLIIGVSTNSVTKKYVTILTIYLKSMICVKNTFKEFI